MDLREHNLPIGTICIEDIEIGMARSVSKTIGDREIAMFAELSTDHNPVHLDDAYAQDTIFEGRIAHGMLTAALISAVIGEQLPGHGTVYLGQTLKFRAPVRPGDRVEATVTVREIDHARRRVTLDCALPGGRYGRARGRGAGAGAEPQVRLTRGRPARQGADEALPGLPRARAADRGAAVAMGNFDGVHLGHQSVLALAHAAAAELDAPFGVVTFEPHPRSFFAPDAPPFRLMTADARARRLEKLGVEVLYELPFDAALAGLSPGGLRPRRAGRGARGAARRGRRRLPLRQGAAPATRRRCGRSARTLGFGVTVAPLVSDGRGGLFLDGDPRRAGRGPAGGGRAHPRALAPDRGRGRSMATSAAGRWAFPTANLGLDGLHLPRFGVYAVLVDVLDGPHRGRYRGVRPRSGCGRPSG